MSKTTWLETALECSILQLLRENSDGGVSLFIEAVFGAFFPFLMKAMVLHDGLVILGA